MTVHSVEIVCSKTQESNPSVVPTPEPPELHNVVGDRVTQNVFDSLTEALPGQSSPADLAKAGSTTSYSVDHVHGRYRVDSSHSKKEVLDAFENDTVIDAEWYEIRYHECNHDDASGSRTHICGYKDSNGEWKSGWKTERSKGTIPDGV